MADFVERSRAMRDILAGFGQLKVLAATLEQAKEVHHQTLSAVTSLANSIDVSKGERCVLILSAHQMADQRLFHRRQLVADQIDGLAASLPSMAAQAVLQLAALSQEIRAEHELPVLQSEAA